MLYPTSLETVDDPNLADQETWEYKAMLSAPHKSNSYLQEKLKVNIIIPRNILDSSDAFTYVKTYLKRDDGRLDIQDLRGRYENAAMHEHYIKEAKSIDGIYLFSITTK